MFARSLHVLGIKERSGVNIMGANSPEWIISYLGAVSHNHVVSGVYGTTGSEGCAY